MKTFKLFTLSIFLFAACLIASANEVKTIPIKSENDLRNSFREMIVTDFASTSGYLYKNDIYRMNETVEVTFLINPDQTIWVVRAKCNNPQAVEYIKQLLDKKLINVPKEMIGMVYEVDLSLDYKAY